MKKSNRNQNTRKGHEENQTLEYNEHNPKAKPIIPRKSKGHKVKSHLWKNGILETFEEFFESFKEALEYANNIVAQLVKIYNEDDEVVHTCSKSVDDTYA
jgi:hypothetical protein